MKIKSLNYSYKYSDDVVLKDINIEIPKGDITAIVGDSGSGKTTLLNILNLTNIIKDIDYVLEGNNISSLKNKEIANLRKMIGTTYQLPEHQIFGLTIREDITFSNRFEKEPKEETEKRLEEVIKLLNIKEKSLEISPFAASEGEKRKITLAGVLMKQPEYIFLDEPTSNIDDYSTNELIQKLKELNEEGKTIVFISHDMDVVKKLAKNLIYIESGSIKYQGPVNEGLLGVKYE